MPIMIAERRLSFSEGSGRPVTVDAGESFEASEDVARALYASGSARLESGPVTETWEHRFTTEGGREIRAVVLPGVFAEIDCE